MFYLFLDWSVELYLKPFLLEWLQCRMECVSRCIAVRMYVCMCVCIYMVSNCYIFMPIVMFLYSSYNLVFVCDVKLLVNYPHVLILLLNCFRAWIWLLQNWIVVDGFTSSLKVVALGMGEKPWGLPREVLEGRGLTDNSFGFCFSQREREGMLFMQLLTVRKFDLPISSLWMSIYCCTRTWTGWSWMQTLCPWLFHLCILGCRRSCLLEPKSQGLERR